MELMHVFKLECCELNLKAKTKEDALKQIAKIMQRAESLQNVSEEQILTGLQERESKGSTGFGNGIAIPHCQLPNIDTFAIGLVLAPKGIAFDSLDGKPAHIFAVIIGPENASKEHLQLLAQVSRILKEENVRKQLLASQTVISLYEGFVQHANVSVQSDVSQGKNKLMMVIVRDEDVMEDLTELFIEFGIQEATILEASQMQNLLSQVPLFLGFFNFTGEKSPFQKIVLAIINETRIYALTKSIEGIVGNLDTYSGITILAVDLFFARGL